MVDRNKLEGIAKNLLEYETLDRSQIKEIVEYGRVMSAPSGAVLSPRKKMFVKHPLGSLGLTARETEVLGWIAQGKTNYMRSA